MCLPSFRVPFIFNLNIIIYAKQIQIKELMSTFDEFVESDYCDNNPFK